MKIRNALVAGGLGLLLATGGTACGSGEKTEYVTTDTVGDCDAGDWATRETDPESMQECAGKTGPDPELDKPHKVKVKKSTKKPGSGTTTKKKDTTTKKNNTRTGTGSRGGRR